MTEINFMENKGLREQMSARVDVLDKVKELFLLPQLEMMTVQQVADYYEVDKEAIKKCYQRNTEEINADGTVKHTIRDIFVRMGQDVTSVKTQYYTEFKLSEEVSLKVPNAGIRLFSKRAILRIGMLLRDSCVAREVRTQLLNAFEKTNDSQKIEDIETEQEAMGEMGLAFIAGDITAFCQAAMKYNSFKQRHIDRLTAENDKLVKENKEQADKIKTDAPKVEYAEAAGSCKNTISIGAYAKVLYGNYGINMGRNNLFKWMRENSILDKNNLPYQKFMNSGWFEVIQIPKPNIKKQIPVTRITAKGQRKLYEKIREYYQTGGIK